MKMKVCNARTLIEMKKIFNSVDPVYGYTIFNIGGNNYRLITAIHTIHSFVILERYGRMLNTANHTIRSS